MEKKKLRSVPADNSKDLVTFANEIGINQSQIVSIVYANNHFVLFYYG